MQSAKSHPQEIASQLAAKIDAFEKYSGQHSRMMTSLSSNIARRLGLDQIDTNSIAEAALLHDIGLYRISPPYLHLPRPLTIEERVDLWRHPVVGEQEMARRGASRHAQLLVRWHHEWWNGTGYPDRLSFEDIPIGARILRAVDLYSALTSDRPFRPGMPEQEAREALRASAGLECDPYIVKALLAFLEEVSPLPAPLSEVHRFPTSDGGQAEKITFQHSPLEVAEPDSTTEEKATAEADLNPSVDAATIARHVVSEGSIRATEPGEAPKPGYTAVESESSPAPEAVDFLSYGDQPFESRLEVEPGANPSPVTEPSASTGDGGSIAGGDEPRHIAASAESGPTLLEPGEVSTRQDYTTQPLEQAERGGFAEERAEVPAVGETPPLTVEEEIASLPTPRGLEPGSSTGVRPSQPLLVPGREANGAERAQLTLVRSAGLSETSPDWYGWVSSAYNTKSLLGFQASILRKLDFRSVAVPICGWAHLVWYLKVWGKQIFSNDPRAWAATASRAVIEGGTLLTPDQITDLIADAYVPTSRLANPRLRVWFGEAEAYFMDNLRARLEGVEDRQARDHAIMLGLRTGDYAQSFGAETADLKRPLTYIFRHYAANAHHSSAGHPYNRSSQMPVEEFVRAVRSDLMYLNLPAGHAEMAGSFARSRWRESWVTRGGDDLSDVAKLITAAQSKQSYLAMVDRILAAAGHLKKWAIECRDVGLATAEEISQLIQSHRPVKATYSKDLTEVTGGLNNYVIIAEIR